MNERKKFEESIGSRLKPLPGPISIEVSAEQGIDLIVEIGRATARRASMFMAFGLTTAGSDEASVHLPGFIQLVDAPREMTDEQMRQFRKDYEAWVVANGFRELINGIEIFLNSYFQILLNAQVHLGVLKAKSHKSHLNKFENKGVADKLGYLEKRYGLTTGFAHYFRTLTGARNCLAHRQGIVGDRDCEKNGALTISWLGIEAHITEADGTVHPISLDTLGPLDTSTFQSGPTLELTTTLVDRELVFYKGQLVEVQPRSLQEICSMTSYVCLKLRQVLLNWLLDEGIKVNGGKLVPDPVASISLEVIEGEG